MNIKREYVVQIWCNIFVITVKFGCTKFWALTKLCYISCIGLRLQIRQQMQTIKIADSRSYHISNAIVKRYITSWLDIVDQLCTCRFKCILNSKCIFSKGGELLYASIVLSCRCYGNLKLDYHCKSATMVLTSWKCHSSIILV